MKGSQTVNGVHVPATGPLGTELGWIEIIPNVGAGQIVSIVTRSGGQWSVHYNGFNTRYVGALGNPQSVPGGGYLAPTLNEAALIGRVRANGFIFLIGGAATFTAPVTGPVDAAMNDIPGSFFDNYGEMILDIHISPGRI